MVKANDDLLGKGTNKEVKKSLTFQERSMNTKAVAFTFDDGPLKNTEKY